MEKVNLFLMACHGDHQSTQVVAVLGKKWLTHESQTSASGLLCEGQGLVYGSVSGPQSQRLKVLVRGGGVLLALL